MTERDNPPVPRTPPAPSLLARLKQAIVVAARRPALIVVALAVEVLVVTLVSGRLAAQPRPNTSSDTLMLSLDEAVTRARRAPGRVETAQAGLRAARAEWQAARAGLRQTVLPVLGLSAQGQRLVQNQFAEIGRRSAPADTATGGADLGPLLQVFAAPNTRTLGLTATIRPYDSGVSAARVRAGRSSMSAGQREVEQAIAEAELEAVESYSALALAHATLQLADSALQQSERVRQVAAKALESGRAPALELLRAESAVATQRAERIAAQRMQDLAELRLKQAIGVPAMQPVRLQTVVLDTADVSAAALTESGTVAAEPRSALQALEDRIDAAYARVDAAWRAQLPRIELTLNHQRFAYPQRSQNINGPWFSNTTLVLQASMPLDLSGATLADVSRARAEVAAARAQRREGALRAEREAMEVETALRSLEAERQAAREAARAAARAHEISVVRYEAGRASLIEVEDARLAWLQREAAKLRVTHEQVVARARAERIARLPLPL